MAKSKKDEPLDKLKTSIFGRSASIARLVVTSGAKMAAAKIQSTFGQAFDPADFAKSHGMALIEELSKLKGGAMKVGQTLGLLLDSIYPGEWSELLKKLNEDSRELSWARIEPALREGLGLELFAELDIEKRALASASLGQVHKATIKATGETICLKIQYPDIDKSIDSDLNAIKKLFRFSKILPDYGQKLDAIFDELKEMLDQELDYEQERAHLEAHRDWIGLDPRFIIPKSYPRYCTNKILALSYEPGIPIDGSQVSQLSLARRKSLAEAYSELFLRELFLFGKVQTDPHFGNYKIRVRKPGQAEDRWVLYDFGALRTFEPDFLLAYLKLIKASLDRKDLDLLEAGESLGFLNGQESEAHKAIFVDICFLIVEPWMTPGGYGVLPDFFDEDELYDWKRSDLFVRVKAKAAEYALAYKMRPPPREIIFLDRKLAGVFATLRALDAPFEASKLLQTILSEAFLKNNRQTK